MNISHEVTYRKISIKDVAHSVKRNWFLIFFITACSIAIGFFIISQIKQTWIGRTSMEIGSFDINPVLTHFYTCTDSNQNNSVLTPFLNYCQQIMSVMSQQESILKQEDVIKFSEKEATFRLYELNGKFYINVHAYDKKTAYDASTLFADKIFELNKTEFDKLHAIFLFNKNGIEEKIKKDRHEIDEINEILKSLSHSNPIHATVLSAYLTRKTALESRIDAIGSDIAQQNIVAISPSKPLPVSIQQENLLYGIIILLSAGVLGLVFSFIIITVKKND